MQFENFLIRPLTQDDLGSFYNLIEQNRSRLEAFFSGTVARTRTFADAETYISEIITRAENKTYLPFLIINTISNEAAGFVDIKNIDWNIPKGELGYFMDIKYAGKGLSKSAFSLFTAYCFKELGFHKLFLRTHNSNTAARRLAESCGFVVEGTLRKDYKTTKGELVDLLYYGRVSEDQDS